MRWGREIDVAVVTDEENGRRRAAAYLAKYSTKSTEHSGVLDHRLRAGVPDALELPDHLRQLVETAWRLGGEPEGRDLRLRAWAHTAGYRGHFLTKSRRFSTTFSALRATRQEWQIAKKRAPGEVGPDHEAGAEDDGLVSDWTFVGMGYTTAGDAWLAESLAEEDCLARRFAVRGTTRADEGVGLMMGPDPEFISIPVWCKRIGCSLDSGYRAARRHDIPGMFRIGRLVRINWDAFRVRYVGDATVGAISWPRVTAAWRSRSTSAWA